MPVPRPVLIVGASARSAAASALRAGWEPHVFDHFGDWDLRQFSRPGESACPQFTRDLAGPWNSVHLTATPGRIPWCYCGGLENEPERIAVLAGRHPLLGNPADVVRSVRNPILLYDRLTSAGIATIPTRPGTSPPPRDGTWLIKPCRSAGGRGIRLWTAGSRLPAEPVYFQAFTPGRPASALFLADGRRAVFVGLAWHLVGGAPTRFGWCGATVGPQPMSSDEGEPQTPLPSFGELETLGAVLVHEFRLVGLFGCDLIVDPAGRARPTEVNPRYTATVELHEERLDLPLFAWHAAACQETADLEEFMRVLAERRRAGAVPRGREAVVGKRIVYAPHRLQAGDFRDRYCPPAAGWPAWADLPAPGTWIEPREPICTVFARGASRVEVAARLGAAVKAVLAACRPPEARQGNEFGSA